MNRFLTKKRTKRQQAAEPKPVAVDLAKALPSNDDFRTSLLMNGLSARFSMLREQDDPTSLLGKASDDSVLQPRRQSRLYDFGYQPSGLSDIAEVSSINGSVRPPFATERTNSYSSDIGGYGTDGETDSGSVMSRARPGEGNVLFGGRQKITRIAGDGRGRTLYDDDVAKSTFQRIRAEERQREAANRERQAGASLEEESKSPSKLASYTASVTDSLKRQTSSSTSTSGMDARSSTAATSVTSQGPHSAPPSTPATVASSNFGSSVGSASSGSQTIASVSSQQTSISSSSVPATNSSAPAVERSMTKRRLYDQGLDRDFQEQQSSTLNRLHSIQKRPGMSNGRGTPDLWQGRNGFASRNGAPPVRSISPSPSPIERDQFPLVNGPQSVQRGRSDTNLSTGSGSPPSTANGERKGVLASAIDPNDRGKATAMGVFNKPKQFNEKQFLERSLTLQKGRDTPPRNEMLTSRGNSEDYIREEAHEPSQTAPAQDARSVPSHYLPNPSESTLDAPLPLLPVQPVAPWNDSRSASSGPLDRVRPSSDEHPSDAPSAPSGFSVFQRAATQMKTVSSPEKEKVQSPSVPSKNKFMFVDDSDSEYDEGKSSSAGQAVKPIPPLPSSRPQDKPLVPPPSYEHPAFRNSPQPSREDLRADLRKPSAESREPITDTTGNQANKLATEPSNTDLESPTPPGGTGLSSMIHHLRSNSATSTYSVATPNIAQVPTFPASLQGRNLNHVTGQDTPNTAHSSYSHSNPWDLEDYKGAYRDVSARDSVNHRDNSKENKTSIPAPAVASNPEPVQEQPTWQQELSKKTHARGGSSETRQEREAFANELAIRQKAIQEKLRERAESPMRSGSPTSHRQGTLKGMLRQKPSLDTFKSRGNDKQMRGLGGNTTTSSSTHPALTNNERPSWETERKEAPRSIPLTIPTLPKEYQHAGYGPASGQGARPGMGRNSDERVHPRSRSNSNAPILMGRNRSDSELSGGRSRSRNGGYRDDSADGAPTMTPATIPEDLPPQKPAPKHPIPELPESPMYAQNGAKGHWPLDALSFQQQGLWPPPQNPIVHPLGMPSPRPSPSYVPSGPLSPSFTGPPQRPSPGLGPMGPAIVPSGRATPIGAYANPTPPLSVSNTPTAPSFAASNPNLASTSGLKAARQRKMSVKKSDISDPILISTTSVASTVDLPHGASLRNGMTTPPVPPINPRRKRFPFGRAETEPADSSHVSGGMMSARSSDEKEPVLRMGHRLKKSSSDGAKIGLYLRAQRDATQSTPALQSLNGSPPKMQNGMF